MFKFVLALLFGFLIFELGKKYKINEHSFTEKFAWMYRASIIQTIINFIFLEYIILTNWIMKGNLHYLPIQKLANILPSTSSFVISPVISAKC